VFGLSFESNIDKNTSSPLEESYRQKLIPSRSFSIKIDKLKNKYDRDKYETSNGLLIIGGFLKEWVKDNKRLRYHKSHTTSKRSDKAYGYNKKAVILDN